MSAAVAGVGTGRVPWSVRTKPDPVGSGEQYSRSTPSARRPAGPATTSTSVSRSPSSCSSVSPASPPWTAASRLAEPGQDCARVLDRPRREPGVADDAKEVVDAQPGVVVWHRDRDVLAPDGAPLGAGRGYAQTVDTEARQRVVEHVDPDAGVEDGADEHVAADPADATQVGNLHAHASDGPGVWRGRGRVSDPALRYT